MIKHHYKLNRLKHHLTLLNICVFSNEIEKIIYDDSDVDIEVTYKVISDRINIWKKRLSDFHLDVQEAEFHRDKLCQRCVHSPEEPCQFCTFAQAVVDKCVANQVYCEAICDYLNDLLFDLDKKRKSK